MTILENKELVEKYPFFKLDDDYKYTMLDDMPKGWRKAFGDKFCEELLDAVKKADLLDDFKIIQIKEKFGALRVYSNKYTDEIFDLFNKYETLSETICIECGKPATKITLGWISPYCDNCIPKNSDGTEVDNKLIKDFNTMIGN